MQSSQSGLQVAGDTGSGSALSDRRVLSLMRDAARWRLLGRMFECPTGAWRQDVARLVDEVADPDLQGAALAALVTGTEGQYHSVFGPGGPAPPREVSYRDTLELGSVMSELTGYYNAFGYNPTTSEPPDHVAVEAGFVGYLCLKEAHALAAGDTEHAAATAEAATRFRADHLALLARPLAALLAESDIPYLYRAASLLSARAGEPQPRSRLTVLQSAVESDDEDEFGCGDAVKW